MTSPIKIYFTKASPIASNIGPSELARSYRLKVDVARERIIYTLEKTPALKDRIKASFASLSTNADAVTICGDELLNLVTKASSCPPIKNSLTGNLDFRKFACSVVRKELPKAKLQRAVCKAAIIGKGQAALARAGMQGKLLEERAWQEALINTHPYCLRIAPYFTKWQESTTELSFASHLEQNHPHLPVSFVRYLKPEERRKHRIVFQDGKLFRNARAFDTAEEEANFEIGKAIYVVGPDFRMYVGSHIMGRFHHSSFFAGGCLLGAGDIRTDKDGALLEISNASGHYNPRRPHLLNTLKFLEKNGVDLSKVKLTLKTFDDPTPKLLRYHSAKAFLDSGGECPPDGYNYFVFSKEGPDTTALTHTNSSVGRIDIYNELKELVADLKLSPSVIPYREKTNWGDVIGYPSIGAYLEKKGKAVLCFWSRGEIVKDSNGNIKAIIKLGPLIDKEKELLSNLQFLSFLEQNGTDLSKIAFCNKDEALDSSSVTALQVYDRAKAEYQKLKTAS